jgi:hypothetical protein
MEPNMQEMRPKMDAWKKVALALGGSAIILFGGCSVLTLGYVAGTTASEASGQHAPARPGPDKAQGEAKEKTVEQKKASEATREAKGAASEGEATKTEPAPASNPASEVSPQDAVTEAQGYYDAASAGDFGYTYSHLGYEARGVYTADQWNTINENAQSAGAAYVVQTATPTGDGTFQVDLTVNGTPRTTYFVLDAGEWYHLPTSEEYALYDEMLASSPSSAPASTPATAPASEATPAASGGEVSVEVVISANKPVDVSILSVDDFGVPTVTEQTQNETYTFSKRPNADLTVDAMDPSNALGANDDIHIEVYENGELKAEDTDDAWAMVSY